jgi:hypothetical protein
VGFAQPGGEALTTGERVFGVNRRCAFFYAAISAAAAAVSAFIFMINCYTLIFRSHSIGGVFFSLFGVVVFGTLLIIIAAFAENLVRTLVVDGPALAISDQGVRYRFASDDVVPWIKVRQAIPVHSAYWGRVGVRLRLSPDLSETMRRRSAIYNAYKSDTITVWFCLVDAPRAEVAQAFLRHEVQ